MSKPERFVFVSDNHGHHQDPHATAVFFEFLKSWRPTVRVHGGDAFDFAALRKGASEGERCEPLNDDIEAGCEFLRRLKPTHFLRGNHDERIFDAIESHDGKIRDYSGTVIERITDAIGDAVMLPYDKRKGILSYGDIKMLHGYAHGLYAARHTAAVYGSCIFGHVHAVDSASVPGIERRVGRCVGSMCMNGQPYNRGHLSSLRHSNGFAYGIKLPSGRVIVYQAESHDGVWYLPTELHAVRPTR